MKESLYRTIRLLEEANGPVSGEVLAERLGVTRAAVWKQIQELREQGYEILASQKDGYTLAQSSGRLLPYQVKKHLKTRVIGQHITYLPTTPSTNDVARWLAIGGDPAALHGTVVIAEEQTGGVGRLGRAWVSPEGGIWITIILTPTIPIDHVFMITMVGAVAVARAIRRDFGLGAMIKWPNDVYIGDKKVAGVLLELAAEADTIHYCLLGIGIDANFDPAVLSPDLQRAVTTLRAEIEHEVDRAKPPGPPAPRLRTALRLTRSPGVRRDPPGMEVDVQHARSARAREHPHEVVRRGGHRHRRVRRPAGPERKRSHRARDRGRPLPYLKVPF